MLHSGVMEQLSGVRYTQVRGKTDKTERKNFAWCEDKKTSQLTNNVLIVFAPSITNVLQKTIILLLKRIIII